MQYLTYAATLVSLESLHLVHTIMIHYCYIVVVSVYCVVYIVFYLLYNLYYFQCHLHSDECYYMVLCGLWRNIITPYMCSQLLIDDNKVTLNFAQVPHFLCINNRKVRDFMSHRAP